MASRAPTLCISVKITDEGSVLTFTPVQGPSLVVKGSLNRLRLIEQRTSLSEDLERFKHLIGSDLKIEHDISKAICHLYRRGLLLTWQLLGENSDYIKKVQDLCRQACPGWALGSVAPPLVEVEAAIEDIVPVEFLPLLDLGQQELPEINDPGALATTVRCFLGFSTIVKRVIPRMPLTSDFILENDRKLQVKFFRHAGLKGVETELAFFQTNGEHVDLEGPWPDQEFDPKKIASLLAGHLWDPALRFNGSNCLPPDQVQHFACHCDTQTGSTENYCLELAHHRDDSCKVTIGDLQVCFARLSIEKVRKPDTTLPLVFLNACGSSKITPAGITSFPNLFLKNRNRGFIGPETRVPDEFASAFSTQFYTELLQGRPLGEAVHLARWRLLERYTNPLGILYTVYADPAIQVRRPAQLRGA